MNLRRCFNPNALAITITSLIAPFSLTAQVLDARPTLTVYTYDSFASEWGPGPAIKQAFEAQCNCTLDWVSLEDGVSLLNRLRLEDSQTKADVVLGLDTNLMVEAQDTGLFAKHQVNTANLTLPVAWQDAYFIPVDYGYFAFVYDKTRVKNPPTSLAQLVFEKNDLSIIYQDPRTSTPGQGLMLWVKQVFGDDAPKAWQQLAQKTVTVTKGWSESYSLFLKGEADMVLSYTTSPAYHLIAEKDSRFASANFSEGHYLQIEIAGKIATSDNPKLADDFLQFVLSKQFQQAIPTGNWMYPVIALDLPSGFAEPAPAQIKSLQFSPQKVARERRTWIREWQHALIAN